MKAEPRGVLVVEDEASIAQVVVDVLTAEGYVVRRAANGLEGLRILESWSPSVIVLDLMMPVMDGRAFRAAQLGPDHRGDAIPVVVLSGAREARAVAEELAVAATLTKPFDIEALVATVARLTSPHLDSVVPPPA